MAVAQAPAHRTPKAEVWSIVEILEHARDGEVLIPLFQRSFVWDASDVKKLFDSIYKGYPIGSLLVWQSPKEQPNARTRFESVAFERGPETRNRYVVVDGQQRLTSLVATLLGSGRDPRFDLGFDAATGTFERRPEPLTHTWLPLHQTADTYTFLEWLQGRTPAFTRAQTDAVNHMVRALRDYKVPVWVVETADEAVVREIFTRLNNTGKALKEAQVFRALHVGREEGVDLSGMNGSLAKLRWGSLDEGWLLKCLAAVDGHLRLKDQAPSDQLRAIAARTLAALRRAIAFLRDEAGIPHADLLPYRFPLLALVRLFDHSPELPAELIDDLRAWVWRGVASSKHRDTSNPNIRAALQAAKEPPAIAIQSLLAHVPPVSPPFKMSRHDFRSAATKLCGIVLLLAKPRHLVEGEPLDPVDQLGQAADSAGLWPHILRRAARAGTENRVFHPPVERGLRALIAEASPEVCASHLVSPEAHACILAGDDDGFLERRRGDIEAAVRAFLARNGVKAQDSASPEATADG